MTTRRKPSHPIATPGAPFLLCTTEGGRTCLEVYLQNDTGWLSLNQMADLCQRDKSTISRHIANHFKEGELERGSVVVDFTTTEPYGKPSPAGLGFQAAMKKVNRLGMNGSRS